MAKLPNFTEERRVAQGVINSGIRPSDIPISPVSKALEETGKTLENTATTIGRVDNYVDKFNYALAKSKITRDNVSLLNKVEQDINDTGDFSSAQANYELGLNNLKDSYGKDLKIPRFKASLDNDVANMRVETTQKIYDLQQKAQQNAIFTAAGKEMDDTLETLAITNNPEDQKKIIDNGLATLVAAVPLADPNRASTIAKIEEEYKKRVGIGAFNRLSPSEQITSLDNYEKNAKAGKKVFSTVEYIPVEDRPIYRNRAEQALKQDRNNLVARLRDDEYLKHYNAKVTSLNHIVNGGSVADIPIGQFALLSEPERNNLDKIQQIKNGTIQVDPVEGQLAFNKYSNMYINNPREFAKIDPITIQAEVSPDKLSKVQGWQQQAQKGMTAPATFGQQNTVLSQSLKMLNIKGKNEALFSQKYQDNITAFREINDKDPSIPELRKIADDLVIDITINNDFWFDSDKKLYQVKGDDLKNITVPEDFANNLLIQAQQANLGPITPEQMRSAYLNKLKAEGKLNERQ